MLERLGVQGMSSDESDREELPRNPRARLETPHFYVHSPRWRATRLTTWLHIFDAAHTVYRRSGEAGLRGAYPRLRVQNMENPVFSSSKKFVRGLPLNAYDQQWLASRNDVPFTIQPAMERYDFDHDNEIFA